MAKPLHIQSGELVLTGPVNNTDTIHISFVDPFSTTPAVVTGLVVVTTGTYTTDFPYHVQNPSPVGFDIRPHSSKGDGVEVRIDWVAVETR